MITKKGNRPVLGVLVQTLPQTSWKKNNFIQKFMKESFEDEKKAAAKLSWKKTKQILLLKMDCLATNQLDRNKAKKDKVGDPCHITGEYRGPANTLFFKFKTKTFSINTNIYV